MRSQSDAAHYLLGHDFSWLRLVDELVNAYGNQQ
jgi:hypothetical protein